MNGEEEPCFCTDYLEESARRRGDKVALVQGANRLTFAEIDRRAEQLARALARRGVRRGDRVAILGEQRAETVIAVWATLKAGAVFMVVSRDVKEDKLAYILRDSGARALITSARLAGLVAAATAKATDLAVVIAYGGDPPRLPGGFVRSLGRGARARGRGARRAARASIRISPRSSTPRAAPASPRA